MAHSSVALGAGLFALIIFFLVTNEISIEEPISVAFVGNSFQFVNDLPRFMEALSQGNIQQDSVLHGSLSFVSLWKKGNGMYHRWNASDAMILNEDDTGVFEDYGSCTVTQLLAGYDDNLENFEDYYVNDGLNPCFQDPDYLQYTNETIRRSSWDFVLFNDQSMRPAYASKRNSSAKALQRKYAPLLIQSGATPVFFMTYGYWRNRINMTDLVDVPYFTSLLYEGYQTYAQAMEEMLPDSQRPRVAPVGLAFLVVWEENYSFWTKLFGADDYHPSPLGTYLVGLVVYATLYERMPPASTRFTSSLWNRARRMQLSSGEGLPLPSEDEALYLRWIAKRVALEGFIPQSLIEKL
jgi:hypothetical protein